MDKLSLNQVQTAVRTMCRVAEEKKEYFSDLDGVMGDADFGVSLAMGFRSVMKRWDTYDVSSIGSFLLGVANQILNNTGGCSGPVWGTLFERLGQTFVGKQELNLSDIMEGFENAVEGIRKRGGAQLGDKTVVDALQAIVDSLKDSAGKNICLNEALDLAARDAYEMREVSKDWMARRGRQRFTGERSIGTYDPGIVAVGEMAVAIAATLK
ncbi:MAG: dihydroxyacetone kinase subunit L [Clostridiales bacterium]|nr:dihydroxyacetone kinase subunit L [Clostridiales bacterium]